MNTSSSHEALLKATELIRKIGDGLSSAHFSLTALDKDLLKKHCQELYECLLVLEATLPAESITHAPEVNANAPVSVEYIDQQAEEIAPEKEMIPVALKPLFQPEPEMQIEEVTEGAPLAEVTNDERQLSLLEETNHEQSIPETEEVRQIAEDPQPTDDENIPVYEPEDPAPPVLNHVEEEVEEEELTLNEKISKAAEKKTFLDRMMLTPIDNIKSHITLNKKVAFIIGLFNQESEDYNKAIDQLNTADNLQAALDIYHMLKTRYGWNPEHDLVKELELLVRRRFSSGT